MSTKSVIDEIVKEALPDIASALLGLFVASETYVKWGNQFLDMRTQDGTAILLPPSGKSDNAMKQRSATKSQHNIIRAFFTEHIRRQFGPAALWNQHVVENWLKLKIRPSPINKCKLDFCFRDLPFDCETGLYRKTS